MKGNHKSTSRRLEFDVAELERSPLRLRRSDHLNRTRLRPPVSVIIPTLNEAENLPLVIPYLPMDWIDEVILVDGRSTDNTIEIARQLLPSIKIVEENIRGKGAALRAGYRAAQGDILVVIDADGSNDPRELPRYVEALLQGADFVKGSRFAPGGGTTDMPRFRKLGNGAFVLMTNLLFGVSFTDLCYGYHAFWRYCLDSINLENVNGFEIDTSLYLDAVLSRLRILEVPSFEGYRFHGVGQLQTIPDGTRVLTTILTKWFTGMQNRNNNLFLGFRGNTRAFSRLSGAESWMDSSTSVAGTNQRFMQLLSIILLGQQDVRDLFDRALKMILDELNAVSGCLMLFDENGNVQEGYTAYDDKIFPINGWSELVQQGLAGWVLKNRKATLVPSTREDPRWLRRSWDESEKGSRSALGVPLMRNNKVVGVLTLVRPQAAQFTSSDLKTLASILEASS